MEIKNITFSYDQKKNHLQHVNADIEKGKITTIIGPNGCGKSTLLGVMANHYKPHQGQVMLAGMPIQAYKLKEFAKKLARSEERRVGKECKWWWWTGDER